MALKKRNTAIQKSQSQSELSEIEDDEPEIPQYRRVLQQVWPHLTWEFFGFEYCALSSELVSMSTQNPKTELEGCVRSDAPTLQNVEYHDSDFDFEWWMLQVEAQALCTCARVHCCSPKTSNLPKQRTCIH
eukprot:8319595-Pyramimonas_sp.AAC.1